MIALKKAPAGVPDQARANNLKTHYYHSISEIVFTSGVLCPACKRGHLHSKKRRKTFRVYTSDGGVQWMAKKVMRCDRCGQEVFLPAVAMEPVFEPAEQEMDKNINLSKLQRQLIMDIIRREFKHRKISQLSLAVKMGMSSNDKISKFLSGKILPKEEILRELCRALHIEWRWS